MRRSCQDIFIDTLTTSHNGTLATTIKPVNTFVVCDNTHVAALSEDGSQFKARHSKYSNLKITNVREALGFVHMMDDEIEREIKKNGAVVEENEALWFYNNIRIKAEADAAYREKMRQKKEKGNV